MPEQKINERDDRLRKLGELKNIIGINPYPAKSNKTHTIKNVLDNFEKLQQNKEIVAIAGRIMSKRGHGNLTFINLKESSGQIQIAVPSFAHNSSGNSHNLFVLL